MDRMFRICDSRLIALAIVNTLTVLFYLFIEQSTGSHIVMLRTWPATFLLFFVVYHHHHPSQLRPTTLSLLTSSTLTSHLSPRSDLPNQQPWIPSVLGCCDICQPNASPAIPRWCYASRSTPSYLNRNQATFSTFRAAILHTGEGGRWR